MTDLCLRAVAARVVLAAALSCPAAAQLLVPGEGVFTYVDTGGNASRTVPVHYVYPPGFDKSDHPRIVFVCHGLGRNALNQRDRFRAYAYVFDALILCPEFDEVHWPTDDHYAQGNVLNSAGGINPEVDWSYSTIEEIFALVAAAVPNAPDTYDCVGHSAGAQFMHRMAMLKTNAPLGRLVAANAGWYLLPDLQQPYPNGVAGVGFSPSDLAVAFARELTITLGTLDNDPNAPDLSHSAWAEMQGPHRYARGHYFYAYCHDLAASRGLDFNWQIADVPGVGHDADDMAPAAVPALFGAPTIRLPAVDDTYVKQNSTNYGSAPEVMVDGDTLKTSYMKFDLSSLAGVWIEAAALRVHVTDSSDATQVVRAVADNSWDEHTLVYGNRPASQGEIGTGRGGIEGSTTMIALTDHVRANRGRVISLSIESTSADGLYFGSKESANPPELVIWETQYGQLFGAGTPGTGGAAPTLAVTRAPLLGGALEFRLVEAAPNQLHVAVASPGRARIPVLGVTLLVDLAGAVTWIGVTDARGDAQESHPIPDNPGLQGMALDLQEIVVDASGPQGLAATRAVEVVLRR